MLSWEYPPRIVGGIARHVYGLSRGLAKLGVDVSVFTCEFPGAPREEKLDGVRIFRVDSYKAPTPNLATWDLMMNQSMEEFAAEILSSNSGDPVLLHAHEWLVAKAAVGLKHTLRLPMMATIHATEAGRRYVLHDDNERMIDQIEYWLTFEAWRIICCSRYMTRQVSAQFSLPADKTITIPNGVDVSDFVGTFNKRNFRREFASPAEKIVLFVGRLVYEKGAGVLLEAIPRVLQKVNCKVIIGSEGYMKEELVAQTKRLGIGQHVVFTGYIDETTLRRLYRVADVCVFPSLYEPFGIVALEAMAAKAPVVVSDVGGFSEIVRDGVNGVKVVPNDAESLAASIIRVLADPAYAENLRANAAKIVQDQYSWNQIAVLTKIIYEEVLEAYRKGSWRMPQRRSWHATGT